MTGQCVLPHIYWALIVEALKVVYSLAQINSSPSFHGISSYFLSKMYQNECHMENDGHNCSDIDAIFVPRPARRQEWDYCFCERHVFVHLFVHSFDTLWFRDSHSWTKPHRILVFSTMIDPIKTLLGIVRQLPSPIFDMVITYFLSLELVPGLSLLNQTA